MSVSEKPRRAPLQKHLRSLRQARELRLGKKKIANSKQPDAPAELDAHRKYVIEKFTQARDSLPSGESSTFSGKIEHAIKLIRSSTDTVFVYPEQSKSVAYAMMDWSLKKAEAGAEERGIIFDKILATIPPSADRTQAKQAAAPERETGPDKKLRGLGARSKGRIHGR